MNKNYVRGRSRICKWCGKLYKKSNSFLFCSRECYRRYLNSKRKTKKCIICKKIFFIAPHEKETRKYCSIACQARSKLKGKFKKCLICKRDFWVIPYRKHKKFCSVKCYALFKTKSVKGENNPNYKNGRSYVKRARRGMGNKLYIKGKNKERKARKILEGWGYWVIPSAGSKGIFDLCAMKENDIRLIQVKTNNNASLAERQQILAFNKCPANSKKEVWIFYDRKKEPVIIPLSQKNSGIIPKRN